jgi:uncharacterized protein (UPF0261 family)
MPRRILATKLAEDGTAVLEFFARHLKQILDDCELTVPEAGDRLKLGIIDPAARQALYSVLRRHQGSVELIEFDCHINDAAFAEAAARQLLKMLRIK